MLNYDIDALQRKARARLVMRGIEPTCLAIYHMTATIRKEELQAERGDARVAPVEGIIAGIDCIDQQGVQQ